MALFNNNSKRTLLLRSLVFFLLFSSSLSDVPPSTPVPAGTACNGTQDPEFCKSVLPSHGSANLFDYGRFSLAKSLSHAYRVYDQVREYLARRGSLSETAVRALQDCQLLAELNIDFLASAGSTCNSTSSLLDPQADGVQTLLSALLTNHQTCVDGLQLAAATGDLAGPLSNGTKLYSLSLSFFARAWAPKGRDRRDHSSFTPATIPATELLNSVNGRKLLQSSTPVKVRQTVVVSKDGTGNFTTISAAVASAPNNTKASDGYYLIHVNAGLYQEYVSISKSTKYIMMVGDGINKTVVTGNHSVDDGWTTFNSATFAVVGEGFVAINMTFRNTAGASKHQAVAVRNGADLSVFYKCSFEGYQDTLYTHSLRQFYRECDIYGTVDYIFGNAAVVFQNCDAYSRLPLQGQKNTVTAQGRTDPNQNTGTSMQNCSIVAAPDLTSSVKSYLGRPWKNYSTTVIMESFIDRLIDPAGWLPWDGNFALSTLYYAEYSNRGPGSDTTGRVTWPGYHVINNTDASKFTVSSFILGDNWIPQTGVPYQSGL